MQAKRIVVVGGGPAGMMAAIRASELKQNVILLEKNPSLGKKLLLSGKGRCNITNACGLELFLKRFSKNGQFLRDSFKAFFNTGLIDFFKKRGLHLKVERQQRVFPATDRSDSVLKVLEAELKKNKVKIISGAWVRKILTERSNVKEAVLEDGKTIPCDRLILATGGVSYRFTGSTGEGLSIAKGLGHRMVLYRPGLVPLVTTQNYPKLLEGLTLKNIRLKFICGKKHIISDMGELLFTGFGISGPLVLSLSGKITEWLHEGKKVSVAIDLKPALSMEQIDARFLREFKVSPGRQIKNTLKDMLPQRMIGLFIDIAKIDPGKRVNQISQAERRDMASLFKGFGLDIKGSRPIEEGMVTRGGVSLKDIDPRTMESRLIKGLYFAGEMIDVDADTGGFNLQAAFSTGYLAGQSAALN
ncbi:MAG: NAD(P)/FAD-dependent oxidoreductase [Candidatus Omnitrophica bacterium]|nr:NAD(P)/FAD-dependent oxidoreductase [Candidatus Omnitrophota bacterium]